MSGLAVLLGLGALSWVSTTTAQGRPPLPLERVRLYESGVGYFERKGTLGARGVELPVPAGHLDDALKTLVVLADDGKAQVSGVEFGSSVSRGMGRVLAGLPAEDTPLGLHGLLKSLKGASVEVRTAGATVTGRLVELAEGSASDLEDCVRPAGKPAPNAAAVEPCVMTKTATLVVLTAAGELRRLRATEVQSVKPTDAAFAARLGSALDALSDRSARTLKELRVLAKAGKSLSLGYVAETPVWRATYRLVLGDAGNDSAALQGWALLHNDTDEQWRNVKVELVNGQPDSFLFPLAAPRYARRELVTPENPLSTVPQLVDATPDSMWEANGAGGLGLSGIGEGGGGSGEGIGLGSIGTIGHGSGTGSMSGAASSLLSVGNLAGVAAAEGVESGALFRYALAAPVDLRPHGSALVPFLSDGTRARRIAWFSAPGQAARAAVHLHHQGKQTLPPGTLAVFADGGFAGETAIDRMKPRESQILHFGFDLDVELVQSDATSNDQTKLLTAGRDKLVEHYVRRHKIAYQIENRSGSARDVFLQLGFVNNSKVEGADEVAYDSKSGHGLAVFRVLPQKKLERKLDASEGLTRAHAFDKLTSRVLVGLTVSKLLPERQRKIVKEAADALRESESRHKAIGERKVELGQAEQDVLRLREHARALGQTRVAGAERIVARLLEAEDRAKSLRKTIAKLRAEAAKHRRGALAALGRLKGAGG